VDCFGAPSIASKIVNCICRPDVLEGEVAALVGQAAAQAGEAEGLAVVNDEAVRDIAIVFSDLNIEIGCPSARTDRAN